jgi:uncharacterized membrane protein (DUF106 family)
MNYYLSLILIWINSIIDAVSVPLLSWIGTVPGWMSNTIISAIVGIFFLVVFKYTSNQKAIGKVKDTIKANMLALWLFKESIIVTFTTEAKLFKSSVVLLLYSVKPVLIMFFPFILILAQLSLWYQKRPLNPGEETLVTVQFNNNIGAEPSTATLQPTTSIETVLGPVTISSKNQVLWKIRALEGGYYTIAFDVNSKILTKELAVGHGFMRTSILRPGYHPLDIILYPAEPPFSPESIVESISIDYPDRSDLFAGTDWWVMYFIVCSIVFAYLFKPVFKVKL